MLTLRREQMEAFEMAALGPFEAYMMAHLRKYFPRLADLLGESGMRQLVRQGYARARPHAFTTRHEVCLFVDLQIMLGCGFDTDPQLPWTELILGQESAPSTTPRINRLYAAALAYLDRVVGADQVFPTKPLHLLRVSPLPELQSRLTMGLEAGAVAELRRLWPEKYDRFDEPHLALLVQQGRTCAQWYGLADEAAVGFYLILMFLFGHQFDQDLQYPLLSQVVHDPGSEGQPPGFENLHRAFMATSDQLLN